MFDDDMEGAQRRFIEALDRMNSYFGEMPNTHELLMISHQNSTPSIVALAESSANSRRSVEIHQIRAAIYEFVRPASLISATPVVLSIILQEYIVDLKNAIKRKRIGIAFVLLRGLLERAAHARAFSKLLLQIRKEFDVSGASPVALLLAKSEDIARYLYGTKVNWLDLPNLDLSTATSKALAYAPKENRADMRATNVMTQLDKLDKEINGLRVVYDILCEFAHPNTGDIFAATTRGSHTVNSNGEKFIVRHFGVGPMVLESFPDLENTIAKIYRVSAQVFDNVPKVHAEISNLAKEIRHRTNLEIHERVRSNETYRHVFNSYDLCPCLSGKKLKWCSR